MLNEPKKIDITSKSKHLQIFLGNLWISSEIFGKVWKYLETFMRPLDNIFLANLRKSSKNGQKSLENRQKHRN